MKDYMEQAAALIHSYVPPSPRQIQAVKDGGRLSANPQAGGKVRLEMKQYLKPGDALTIDVDRRRTSCSLLASTAISTRRTTLSRWRCR